MSDVKRYNSKQRPEKQRSYEYLFGGLEGKVIDTALLMPSAQCLDVQWLLRQGVITTKTQLYVVEHDGDTHCEMIERLAGLGFRRGVNLHDACCDLHEFGVTELVSLPESFDLVFIDLFGSILLEDAKWMAAILAPTLKPTTRFCMTVLASHRNNSWIEEVWRIMRKERPDIVADFRATRGYEDDFLNKPALWLKLILSGLRFKQDQLHTYNDTGSRMLSMRMSGFEPNKPGALSHDDVEPEMDKSREREFRTERHGETAEEVAARNERSLNRRQIAEAAMKKNNRAIWPHNGWLRVMIVDANDRAREENRFVTYHEICKQYNLL